MLTEAAAFQPALPSYCSWAATKPIVNLVHIDVYAHATLSGMYTQLHRNGILSHDPEDYLSSVVESCRGCRATALPQVSWKVSLSTLSGQLNDVACFYHIFLYHVRLFHAMYAGSH